MQHLDYLRDFMSSKSIGIRKEWSLKRKLEREGFLVLRSSASKTGIDLIAGRTVDGRKEIKAFQVQTSPYIYPEKVEELERFAKALNAEPVIAIHNNGWSFVNPKKLKKSGKMFKVDLK